MEIIRDNQKDKRGSSIPYSPDLFHNDKDFYLAYRKIEHIVAAIFLVTGLMEQDELMKGTIRSHSLQCLTRIVSLIGKSAITVTDLQAVATYLLHLSSLLDIAFWSGQVSQMNLSILQSEISTTYKTLNDLSGKYKNSFFIDSSFFRSDEDIMSDIKDKNSNIKDSKVQSDMSLIKDNKTTLTQQTIQNKGHEVKDISKDQRRQAILALLQQKTNLAVKDFVEVVPEYSEKTIQRELLALVEEGIIKKEGERRWSTYSLQ